MRWVSGRGSYGEFMDRCVVLCERAVVLVMSTRSSWEVECGFSSGAACVNTSSMNSSAQVRMLRVGAAFIFNFFLEQ